MQLQYMYHTTQLITRNPSGRLQLEHNMQMKYQYQLLVTHHLQCEVHLSSVVSLSPSTSQLHFQRTSDQGTCTSCVQHPDSIQQIAEKGMQQSRKLQAKSTSVLAEQELMLLYTTLKIRISQRPQKISQPPTTQRQPSPRQQHWWDKVSKPFCIAFLLWYNQRCLCIAPPTTEFIVPHKLITV